MTRLSSILKSLAFGLHHGWNSLIIHTVYGTGFIFALLLMHDTEHPSITLNNAIVVSRFFLNL